MAQWQERLRSIKQFRSFAGIVASIFRDTDDPEAVARALADRNFEEAVEKTDLTEEQFAERFRDMEGMAHDLVSNKDVSDALDEYEQEPCEPTNS